MQYASDGAPLARVAASHSPGACPLRLPTCVLLIGLLLLDGCTGGAGYLLRRAGPKRAFSGGGGRSPSSWRARTRSGAPRTAPAGAGRARVRGAATRPPRGAELHDLRRRRGRGPGVRVGRPRGAIASAFTWRYPLVGRLPYRGSSPGRTRRRRRGRSARRSSTSTSIPRWPSARSLVRGPAPLQRGHRPARGRRRDDPPRALPRDASTSPARLPSTNRRRRSPATGVRSPSFAAARARMPRGATRHAAAGPRSWRGAGARPVGRTATWALRGTSADPLREQRRTQLLRAAAAALARRSLVSGGLLPPTTRVCSATSST